MYKRTMAFVIIVGFFPFLAFINFLLDIGYSKEVDPLGWLLVTVFLAIISGFALGGDYDAYKSVLCPTCKKPGKIIGTGTMEDSFGTTDSCGLINTWEVYTYQCECGKEWNSSAKIEECIFKS